MNPEEGFLRPQIIDRIGLRVVVGALTDPLERLTIARHVHAFGDDREAFAAQYAGLTAAAAASIATARAALPTVRVSPAAEEAAIRLITRLGIESNRTEIVLFEAARAYAAIDERTEATVEDVRAVAPLVVRRRRSLGTDAFWAATREEESLIQAELAALQPRAPRTRRPAKPATAPADPSRDGSGRG
jgi:magnesium chelatase subunit I